MSSPTLKLQGPPDSIESRAEEHFAHAQVIHHKSTCYTSEHVLVLSMSRRVPPTDSSAVRVTCSRDALSSMLLSLTTGVVLVVFGCGALTKSFLILTDVLQGNYDKSLNI